MAPIHSYTGDFFCMWMLDFPERDATHYANPSYRQFIYFDLAQNQLLALKATLESLTIPQQRQIIGQLAGGVYRNVGPAGDDPRVL